MQRNLPSRKSCSSSSSIATCSSWMHLRVHPPSSYRTPNWGGGGLLVAAPPPPSQETRSCSCRYSTLGTGGCILASPRCPKSATSGATCSPVAAGVRANGTLGAGGRTPPAPGALGAPPSASLAAGWLPKSAGTARWALGDVSPPAPGERHQRRHLQPGGCQGLHEWRSGR